MVPTHEDTVNLWLCHPTGNVAVRALLRELMVRDEDFEFFTTYGIASNNRNHRRAYDIPRARLHTSPVREIARLLYQRAFQTPPPPALPWSVDNIYRNFDAHVARKLRSQKPRTVYAYEDGALATFRAARAVGITCAYDLPIAYWETTHPILQEEAERLPAWEPTLLSTRDSREKLDRKTQELELADYIICPGDFVYQSLPAAIRSSRRCVVSPFGSPSVPPFAHPETRGKLRVLFAGSMTQRKGLGDVFAAMQMLKRSDIELRIVGTPLLSFDFYRAEFPDFIYEPTRSHDAILELMRNSDLLVLPSIVEGRALVQQEALACGLPLIVTFNAGGSDLVEEGRTGFLVPIRSPESIAEKINWFADHRAALPEMRFACQDKARQYTWTSYASRILAAVTSSEPNTTSTVAVSDAHSPPMPSQLQ